MLSRGDTGPLQYGAPQGYGPYLESLASFLSAQRAYGMAVDPHDLFLTAGASQGLDLACTLYARAGDIAVVEEPTYFIIDKNIPRTRFGSRWHPNRFGRHGCWRVGRRAAKWPPAQTCLHYTDLSESNRRLYVF